MTEIEWIEHYRTNTLSEAEMWQFEQKLQADVAFAERVQQHLGFIKDLKQYGKRKSMKMMLNRFHQEMESEMENESTKIEVIAANENPLKETAKIISFFPFNTPKYDLAGLRKKYMPTVAIAASVGIFTAFCTLYALQYTSSVEKTQLSNYKQLKKEVDKLKIQQRDLERKESSTENNSTIVSKKESRYNGTGFAVASSGLIVTSYHLVQQKPDSIIVESSRLSDFRYKANLVYFDEANDLALLQITDANFKGLGNLPYTFKPKDADLGEEIFTLAHPKHDVVYGEGVISSKSGYEGAVNPANSYQISIPVNPGYSGSPVFDSNGNVLGLIAGKQTDAEGVGFALKSERLLQVMNELPDSVPIKLPQQNKLTKLKRPQQLKKIQDFVFQVKVY
jgi:serine protease Do